VTSFRDLLSRRVILLDGGLGTQVQAHHLDLRRDFLGHENCTEILVRSRPDVVEEIHAAYLAAGADAVETNTFGTLPHVLQEFGLAGEARAMAAEAVRIARRAANRFSTPDRPRFVVGALGPGTKLASLGQVDWETLAASYRAAVDGLLDGGADAILLETCQDLLQVKCALAAAFEALRDRGTGPERLPVWVQVTLERQGATTLTGSSLETVITVLKPFPIAALGLNCATGPEDMAGSLELLARHWDRPVACLPNAGLPGIVDGRTVYPLGPEPFAETMARFADRYGLGLVGGCCGTTPGHIAALARRLGTRAPAAVPKAPLPPATASLYGPVPHRQEATVLCIGERCNASGSRAFRALLEAGNWTEIVALAREQARGGAHVLDVNVDVAGRDNPRDMREVVSRLVRQVDAPLMLDSSQPAVIEAGLRACGGKAVINSANFEEGDARFDRVCALAARHGAAIVLGTLDEDPAEALARTADRKLAIARRAVDRAVRVHGLPEEDLFIDPLVLPVSTGMEKDRGSGRETIEGVRRIAAALPGVQTVVGLSNVSFGLKPAARAVLNSAFLHELRAAGLTAAIVHAGAIRPRHRVPAAHWEAALDLLHDRRRPPGAEAVLRDGTRTGDPLAIFVDLFAGPAAAAADGAATDAARLPVEERLRRHIVDGERKGLEATLDEALAKHAPLALINDHLLAGMRTVGELFGAGQMQLPFVLQSAEVMKHAVDHLRPRMPAAAAGRGAIVLATVRGDVHDIGKNLVDILLTNNGYTVHNLGIKQTTEAILEAWRRTRADAIGLSGLLVKSVHVMEETLRAMQAQGADVPVLLGGAALSKPYCEDRLRTLYNPGVPGRGVYHGQDAFEALRIMDHLTGGRAAALDARIATRSAERARHAARAAATHGTDAPAADATGRAAIAAVPPPAPPFWGSRVVERLDPRDLYPLLNTKSLFRLQWQLAKGDRDDAAYARLLATEAVPVLERLKDELAGVLAPRVAYGYFPCGADGDALAVFDPADPAREIARLAFPRQANRGRLCLGDFFAPAAGGPGRRDVLALQCVTVGPGVAEREHALFERGEYREYLFVHGLGVEAAEALAELWHQRVRRELGIAGDDAPSAEGLFAKRYRGCRYAPGYPAWPELRDHETIWRLIDPSRIGCRLTETWQMVPEQSTCCLIAHHPAAHPFIVS
jgi:5-methyltetrahydrofolate--homocysteine methyltransferase